MVVGKDGDAAMYRDGSMAMGKGKDAAMYQGRRIAVGKSGKRVCVEAGVRQ